jgi:transcriptional regulator with XRE-family HTH domain
MLPRCYYFVQGVFSLNGIAFGKELKKLRNKAGVPSKVLSTKVGKAVTYVSQLENGKIRNPDFDTCFNLLKELGVEENQIEGMLDYFGIMSRKREEAELEWNIKVLEQEEEKWRLGWYEKKINTLVKKNRIFHKRMESFIQYDLSRAEEVINNLISLTEDEEKFDFLCSLFENNYASLDSEDMRQLLRTINHFVKEKSTKQFNSKFQEGIKEDKQ